MFYTSKQFTNRHFDGNRAAFENALSSGLLPFVILPGIKQRRFTDSHFDEYKRNLEKRTIRRPIKSSEPERRLYSENGRRLSPLERTFKKLERRFSQ